MSNGTGGYGGSAGGNYIGRPMPPNNGTRPPMMQPQGGAFGYGAPTGGGDPFEGVGGGANFIGAPSGPPAGGSRPPMMQPQQAAGGGYGGGMGYGSGDFRNAGGAGNFNGWAGAGNFNGWAGAGNFNGWAGAYPGSARNPVAMSPGSLGPLWGAPSGPTWARSKANPANQTGVGSGGWEDNLIYGGGDPRMAGSTGFAQQAIGAGYKPPGWNGPVNPMTPNNMYNYFNGQGNPQDMTKWLQSMRAFNPNFGNGWTPPTGS